MQFDRGYFLSTCWSVLRLDDECQIAQDSQVIIVLERHFTLKHKTTVHLVKYPWTPCCFGLLEEGVQTGLTGRSWEVSRRRSVPGGLLINLTMSASRTRLTISFTSHIWSQGHILEERRPMNYELKNTKLQSIRRITNSPCCIQDTRVDVFTATGSDLETINELVWLIRLPWSRYYLQILITLDCFPGFVMEAGGGRGEAKTRVSFTQAGPTRGASFTGGSHDELRCTC